MRDQTSGELAGWLAYLCVDDEVQTQRIARAILKALSGGKQQPTKQHGEDEKPIDTTDPSFAEKFKGFTYGDKQQRPRRPQTSTQILMG